MLGRINFEQRSSAMPSAITQTSGLFGTVCCRPDAAPSPPPASEWGPSPAGQ
jgi:hypothetical protein